MAKAGISIIQDISDFLYSNSLNGGTAICRSRTVMPRTISDFTPCQVDPKSGQTGSQTVEVIEIECRGMKRGAYK